jgi:long-chain acyl-CoA synthetase
MIVNAGGKNIYPGPIEDLLKTSLYIDQAVVVGEKRDYMTALIVPDMEQVRDFVKNHHIQAESEEELLNHPDIYKIFEKEIKGFSKKLPSHEKIRRFKLLNTEFTVESGELTPTLKVKRRVIEQRYSNEIAAMYQTGR